MAAAPAREDVVDPEDFLAAVGDAYRDCVLGGVDMRTAVAALESVREAARRNPESFPTWRELDDQIGRASSDAMAEALIGLRARYESALIAGCVQWAADADFDAWLALLGQSLVEWRLSLCVTLAEHVARRGRLADNDTDAEIAALPQRFAAMTRRDWDQALPAIEWLGREPTVAPADRARLISRAAQVDLYFAGDVAGARRRLETAMTLAGSDRAVAEVRCVLGQCHIESQEPGQAAEQLEIAAAADSRFVESFAFRGDVALKANDLATAESWYRRALSAHSGSTTGYQRMVQLLGRSELFESRRGEIGPLVERAVRVVPLEASANLGEAADALREAGDLHGALHFAERSVALGPQQGQSHYARGLVYAALQQWAEALADFRSAMAKEPSRYEKIRWYSLGVPEAVEAMRAELDRRPDDPIVRDALLCYVEESHQDDDRLETALAVLDDLDRHVSADDRKAVATLANSRGDLHFWRKDYAAARPGFRRAWDLEPGVALYADNLVTTLRWLDEFDEAETVVNTTAALTGNASARDLALASIANDRGNTSFGDSRYDEAAEQYARAAGLAPDEAVYRSNLARAIDHTVVGDIDAGTVDRALASLERAIAVYPGDARLAERLVAFRHLQRGVRRYGIDFLRGERIALRIRISKTLSPLSSPDGKSLDPALADTIAGMRSWFQTDLGIVLPGVRIVEDDDAPPDRYELEVCGTAVHRQVLQTDRRMMTGEAILAQARDRGIEGETARNPLNGEPAMWIRAADWPRVEAMGFPLWSVMDHAVYDLSYHALRRLSSLVGHAETYALLDQHAPPSATTLQDSPGMLTRLVRVLRGLLAERVPITAFAEIAELVAAAPPGAIAPLLQACRMLPGVRAGLPGAQLDAVRVQLPPEIETVLADALHGHGPEPVLALSSDAIRSILEQVQGLISTQPRLAALVVRGASIRAPARRVVELAYPQLWVVAEAEVAVQVPPTEAMAPTAATADRQLVGAGSS